jgi:hypothetical protein
VSGGLDAKCHRQEFQTSLTTKLHVAEALRTRDRISESIDQFSSLRLEWYVRTLIAHTIAWNRSCICLKLTTTPFGRQSQHILTDVIVLTSQHKGFTFSMKIPGPSIKPASWS